jgi:hypothetical protein
MRERSVQETLLHLRMIDMTGVGDDLTAAYRAAVGELALLGDGKAGFDTAGELAELLRGLAVEAADVRATIVGRLYASHRMSYAELSNLLGVSQVRVRQLIKAAARGTSVKPTPVPRVPGEPVPLPVVLAPPEPCMKSKTEG